MRYIELNPVRAGMVEDPSDYPWSSYGVNALGKHDKLCTPHSLYQRIGRNADERQKGYQELFRKDITEVELDEIREATNKASTLTHSDPPLLTKTDPPCWELRKLKPVDMRGEFDYQ
jgi:putative transposase